MKSLEEISADRRINLTKSVNPNELWGDCSVNGIKCSLIASWYGGWEHVSIAPYDKKITPSWNDMCKLKNMFWSEDEAVVQIHPRKQDYVNAAKNCLHLWKPIEQELPLPPKEFV